MRGLNVMVKPNIYRKIRHKLELIEKKYDVQIIFAVESGSRAWGFPSRESDYDVRFVYIHKKEKYLEIGSVGDTIVEFSKDRLFDFVGWDIRKYLSLALKSNTQCWEWLNSPTIYVNKYNLMDKIYHDIRRYFSQLGHYESFRSIAYDTWKGSFQERERMQGGSPDSTIKGFNLVTIDPDTVNIKKYLYMIRAIVSMRYIRKFNMPAPIHLMEMVNALGTDVYSDMANTEPFDIVYAHSFWSPALIQKLVDVKINTIEERNMIKRDPLLEQFMNDLFPEMILKRRGENLHTAKHRGVDDLNKLIIQIYNTIDKSKEFAGPTKCSEVPTDYILWHINIWNSSNRYPSWIEIRDWFTTRIPKKIMMSKLARMEHRGLIEEVTSSGGMRIMKKGLDVILPSFKCPLGCHNPELEGKNERE